MSYRKSQLMHGATATQLWGDSEVRGRRRARRRSAPSKCAVRMNPIQELSRELFVSRRDILFFQVRADEETPSFEFRDRPC